jgi:hypothetical protein
MFVRVSGAALGSLAAGASAQLVAYDGMDGGARPDLAGYAGGVGWAGAWQDLGSSIPTPVGGGGLTYPGLASLPGQATTGPGFLPDMAMYYRAMAPMSGDTMFVSVLMQPRADFAGWYIFRFGNYPMQCDLGAPIGYYVYGLTLGDGLIVPTGVPVVAGQTALLVLEIARDAPANRTSYSLYVNPVVGQPKPSFPSASYARAGLIPLAPGVEIRGEGGMAFDELRIGATWESVLPGSCYANCDGSTVAPVLNVLDFNCFLTRFSAGDAYANCDGSTVAPVLNVLDFNCFLNRFSAGDAYANCDGSTVAPVLNVLDFNCFLNRFAAGCP